MTMFRVHEGLRLGLAWRRQQRPLWPLLPAVITGHLWQPCHGKEGGIGKHDRSITVAQVELVINRWIQKYDRHSGGAASFDGMSWVEAPAICMTHDITTGYWTSSAKSLQTKSL